MQNITPNQLKDFIRDRCSGEQAEKVKTWFMEHRDSAEFDHALSIMWDEVSDVDNPARARAAYERFCREAGIAPRPAQELKKVGTVRPHPVLKWMQRFAAVLLLPVAVTCLYFYGQSGRPQHWVEDFVPYGQRKQITLPDQSVVWLNAGSRIIYPERFNNRIRQVYVTGEAYIDVAKDPSRPFYVAASNVNIRVLGTKFNVKSYPEESKTEVSLLEGSIALEVDCNGVLKKYTLSPGTFMSFDRLTGQTEALQFSVREYNSWSDVSSGLYFRNLTLEEIARELERNFDVRIVIRDEKLKHEKYYASFVNGESVTDILTALNVGGSMRFSRQNGVIDIYVAQK